MPKQTPKQIARRNQDTLNYFVKYWLENSRENTYYINQAMEHGNHAHNIPFNGKDPMEGIVIVASGPSLYKQREHLKELNKYLVICSPTNYSTCLAYGLIPDIVTVADSQVMMAYNMFNVVEHPKDINLVVSTSVHPKLFHVFPKEKFYWFKSYIQNEKGNLQSPYNHLIDLLFSNVKDHIMQAGNVTNLSLILVELLRKCGRFGEKKEQPRVFLVGYDLCFDMEGFRSPKYFQKDDRTWEQFPLPRVDDDLDTKLLLEFEGKYTNTQMYNYRRSFLMLWQTIPWLVWGCSESTALKEVPYWDIEDLAEGYLPKGKYPVDRGKAWEEYQQLPNPTKDDKPFDVMHMTAEDMIDVTTSDDITSNSEVVTDDSPS
jgi:hypothetical protein